MSLLSDDQQDLQRGEQEYSSQRRSSQRGIHVCQRWGGILLWGKVKYSFKPCVLPSNCYFLIKVYLKKKTDLIKVIHFLAYLSFVRVLLTASHHQVPLLGPGRGRLLFERQVVIRRCTHETLQDSDADTSRQNACHYGQTQRIPNCVNLAINLRHLCTHWRPSGSWIWFSTRPYKTHWYCRQQ